MLHVLVKTKDMGKRKAWYVGAVVCGSLFNIETRQNMPVTYAIVVFKNNSDKRFYQVEIEDVFLDTSFKAESDPVVDSLRTINLKLRKRKA